MREPLACRAACQNASVSGVCVSALLRPSPAFQPLRILLLRKPPPATEPFRALRVPKPPKSQKRVKKEPPVPSGPRGPKSPKRVRKESKTSQKRVKKNFVHFPICACHPCAGAMLIFSVSFSWESHCSSHRIMFQKYF